MAKGQDKPEKNKKINPKKNKTIPTKRKRFPAFKLLFCRKGVRDGQLDYGRRFEAVVDDVRSAFAN